MRLGGGKQGSRKEREKGGKERSVERLLYQKATLALDITHYVLGYVV